VALAIDLQALHREELAIAGYRRMYFTLPPAPATCTATLKSLPWCGPTARSSVEKVKLGVIVEVMMPLSWFWPCDAGTERERLEDVARVVVEGRHRRPRQRVRHADARDAGTAEQMRSGSLAESVRPVVDWL
jgi:hypothetical protein